MKRLLLTLCLAALPLTAAADVKTRGKTIDCYCTDKSGSRVELGETICLVVDGRAFMAQCQMSLNNPMWRDTGRGCVSSGLGERFEKLDPAADAPLVDAKI